MSKFKTDVIYKVTQEAKAGGLEMGDLYFMNVPVTYAKVLQPAKKYQSEDMAYALNVFITAESMEKVEEIGVNKEFAEVGVTKIKKGQNRGKFKYPLDVEANAPFKDMFAAQLSRATVKRNDVGEIVKEYTPLKVVDTKGVAFTKEVGNGSICHVKCFSYRNADGMLVLMMDTVVVVDHVEYIKPDGNNFDEILGIAIQANTGIEDFPVEEAKSAGKPATSSTTRANAAKTSNKSSGNTNSAITVLAVDSDNDSEQEFEDDLPF